MESSILESNTYREDWQPWRKHLYEHGWAVVPGVVPNDRCESYKDSFWSWIENFGKGIDRKRKSTWKEELWPHNLGGIIQQYGIGHEDFIWKIRCEQGILDVFEKIYGTDKLLVSFDGACLQRPGQPLLKKPHLDQGSNRRGEFRCVQGFLNLMDCGDLDGGLMVYDKSNWLHKKYFDDSGIQSIGDWHRISEEDERTHFKDCPPIKVNCKVGDLVLWDSRTIHYGSLTQSNNCRMVVYTSYQPRSFITPEDLSRKQEIFRQKRMTSHWAAENMKMFDANPKNKENKNFQYDTNNLPVLTERGQQLAGLIDYN